VGDRDSVVGNEPDTGKRQLGGITGRGFMPGRAANPKGLNGKQKGLAALVRRSTKQGKELVGFMLTVARGGHVRVSVTTMAGLVLDVDRRATVADRIEAVKWLADRGWGKAKEVIALEGEVRVPVQIVLLGEGGDPLARPQERILEARALPAAPPAPRATKKAAPTPTESLPEIGFTMDDPTGP